MLAARVHAIGTTPLIEELPEPAPAAGESLVAIIAANVERLDLDVIAGEFPLLPDVPYIPGVSGVGRVLASSTFRPGEVVHIDGADVGLGRDGTWTQRAAVPDVALTAVPADLDPLAFAAFCGSFVAAHLAVVDIGAMRPGERVIVTGAAGNVGALAAQLALAGGARRVVGTVSRDESRAHVPAGAVAVVGTDASAAALDGPADLLIDTVGGDQLPGLLDLVTGGGRACLVGYTAGKTVALDLPRLLVADVRLLPVNSIGWRERSTADPIRELRRGRLAAPWQARPLRDLGEALHEVHAGRIRGRLLLVADEADEHTVD